MSLSSMSGECPPFREFIDLHLIVVNEQCAERFVREIVQPEAYILSFEESIEHVGVPRRFLPIDTSVQSSL